jgi:CheY-like chemotaxis protein
MKSLSILLVDDDEIERIKFKKVGKKTRFNITIQEAKNGKNAITLLENTINSFDLIITDINMPEMNGLDFLFHLKNNNKFKKIPVVIMSSSKEDKDLKKCYELGVSGYFIKPILFSEYINKVESLLNYWQKSEVFISL